MYTIFVIVLQGACTPGGRELELNPAVLPLLPSLSGSIEVELGFIEVLVINANDSMVA